MLLKRIFFIITFIIFVFFGSKCTEKKGEIEVSRDKIQLAVSNYFSSVNNLDSKAWISNFSSNAVSYDPVGSYTYKGREELEKLFSGIKKIFRL